jgi:hypothetical protein
MEPVNVAVDDEGNAYVTEVSGRIQKFRVRLPVLQASPSPEAATEQTLAEFTLPEDVFPDGGRADIYLRHFIAPANTESSWSGSSGAPAPGLWGDYILSGTLTMSSAGPVEVVRAGGDGALESVPVGTPVELAPGDTVLHRTHYDTSWTIGPETVEILSWHVIEPNWTTYTQPGGWTEHNFDFGMDTLDPGPAHVRVWSAVIGPDDEIPGLDVGTQRGVLIHQDGVYIRRDAIDHAIGLVVAKGPTPVYVLTITPV